MSTLRLCARCKSPSKQLKKCIRCKTVAYCSKQCQTAHWKNGGHKITCEILAHIHGCDDDANLFLVAEEGECAICKQAIVAGALTRALPCEHSGRFHLACMRDLERRGVATACPVCRRAIPHFGARALLDEAHFLAHRAQATRDRTAHRRLWRAARRLFRAVVDLGPALHAGPPGADDGTHRAARLALASAHLALGDHARAAALSRRVLARRAKGEPGGGGWAAEVLAYGTLGKALLQLAREKGEAGDAAGAAAALEEAAATIRRAIAHSDPTGADRASVGTGGGGGDSEAGGSEVDAAILASNAHAEHAGLHCNLATALQGLGRVDAAIAAYKDALRHAPRHAPVHADALANLGAVLMNAKGDAKAAARVLRQAVAVAPGHGAARVNLGAVLANTGDLPGAVREWRAAVALDPFAREAWTFLEAACERLGDAAGAAEARARVERIAAANARPVDGVRALEHSPLADAKNPPRDGEMTPKKKKKKKKKKRRKRKKKAKAQALAGGFPPDMPPPTYEEAMAMAVEPPSPPPSSAAAAAVPMDDVDEETGEKFVLGSPLALPPGFAAAAVSMEGLLDE